MTRRRGSSSPLACLRALAKPGAWADQPWEGDHVAKVGEKIFSFLGDEAHRGQVRHPRRGRRVARRVPRRRVGDGLHRAPRLEQPAHRWGDPHECSCEAVDTSYDLVVATLPKSRRPQA